MDGTIGHTMGWGRPDPATQARVSYASGGRRVTIPSTRVSTRYGVRRSGEGQIVDDEAEHRPVEQDHARTVTSHGMAFAPPGPAARSRCRAARRLAALPSVDGRHRADSFVALRPPPGRRSLRTGVSRQGLPAATQEAQGLLLLEVEGACRGSGQAPDTLAELPYRRPYVRFGQDA